MDWIQLISTNWTRKQINWAESIQSQLFSHQNRKEKKIQLKQVFFYMWTYNSDIDFSGVGIGEKSFSNAENWILWCRLHVLPPRGNGSNSVCGAGAEDSLGNWGSKCHVAKIFLIYRKFDLVKATVLSEKRILERRREETTRKREKRSSWN